LRLLNRSTRSVTLTEAGQGLLDRIGPALSEVTAAVEAVGSLRNRVAGTLRLNVPIFVARTILPRILLPFLSAHPDINIEITAEDSFVDVLAGGYDAGIRYDERLEKDMIAVPIGPRRQRFATAAAPSYLDRAGRPQHPDELMSHACLRRRFTSGVVASWEFEKDGQVVRVSPPARVLANSTALKFAAAVGGLGVMSGFELEIAPFIARGELEAVLPDWWQSFSGPYLYYSSRRHMPGPLRAFVDHVKVDRSWRDAQ
jgi:DNA-binding transcriptional LysR family regulator